MANGVRSLIVHHLAKFYGDCSNCCKHSNLLFFKMAFFYHLGMTGNVLELSTKSTRRSLSLCKIWLELMQ